MLLLAVPCAQNILIPLSSMGHVLIGGDATSLHYSRIHIAEVGGGAFRHYLYYCPVLTRAKLRTLGKPFFVALKEIFSCRMGELLPFTNAIG